MIIDVDSGCLILVPGYSHPIQDQAERPPSFWADIQYKNIHDQ